MPAMGHRQFLSVVLDQIEGSMPPGVLPWQARQRFSMLQIHFGNPRVHYELWLQSRTGVAELGLHFEDEPEVNAAWCATFAERVLELRHLLGPELEPEEWTQRWLRLHLAVPLRPLDERYAEELTERFGGLIIATHEGLRAGPPLPRHGASKRRSGRPAFAAQR